jgi:hypothetical protein
MLVLGLCVLALASPVLLGGKISRLAYVRFRGWWIVVAALLAQIVIISVFPGANKTLLDAVHMLTYVAAAVFVGMNWRIPGLLIIGFGGALNGVTIALNHGQLPASRAAQQMAGIEVAKGDFINSGVLPHPVLPLLGDIFVWPEPFPLANVYSFGDMLIVIGAFYGAHKIAGSRLVKHGWQPAIDAEAEHAALNTDNVDDVELNGNQPAAKAPRHRAPVRPITGEVPHTS